MDIASDSRGVKLKRVVTSDQEINIEKYITIAHDIFLDSVLRHKHRRLEISMTCASFGSQRKCAFCITALPRVALGTYPPESRGGGTEVFCVLGLNLRSTSPAPSHTVQEHIVASHGIVIID